MRVTATLPGGATRTGTGRASNLPALTPAAITRAAHDDLTPATADQGRTARPMLMHRRSAPFLAQLVLQYDQADACSTERDARRRAAGTAYARRPKSGTRQDGRGTRASLKV